MAQYNYISGKLVQSAPAASVAVSNVAALQNPANFGRPIRTKPDNEFYRWALVLYTGMTVAVGSDLYVWNGGVVGKNTTLRIQDPELELPIGENGWKKVGGGSRTVVDDETIKYNTGKDEQAGTYDDELYVNNVIGGSF